MYAWTLIPVGILETSHTYKVRVLIDQSKREQYESFKRHLRRKNQSKEGKQDLPVDLPVDEWVNELKEKDGKIISFEAKAAPSIRLICEHASQAFVNAKTMDWMHLDQELMDIEAYKGLSPLKTLANSEASEGEE